MTPSEIADWMLIEVQRDGVIHQDAVASEIERMFGEEFTPINENGNLSIRKDVLAAFRKISEDSVVWERGERFWRIRAPYDEPGRRQD
jgi:hypothetical protein